MGKIEIDLDWAGSGDGESYGGNVETGIRQDAMRQVLRKLAAMPGREEPEQDDRFKSRPRALNVMPNRRHEAILVSARRGDGKTTFLIDILRLIEKGASAYRPYVPTGKADEKLAALYSLGIVDPTLIETKQNIVVIVIEKIKVAVDHVHRRNEAAKKGTYEDFKAALRELAAGLTLLDGIGNDALYGKDWADADYVLDRGLDKARSAGGFERAFHHYVREACSFIGADAFVLAIDDVDTSFDKGWPVLEALRKYFATPHLKVILAGDLKLYNLLVRQQQWKQITKDFLDVEQKVFKIEQEVGGSGSYADQLVKTVDVLQDQYLVKIVRPENRIELAPLLHLTSQSNEIEFHASRSATPGSAKERDTSRRFAERLLCIKSSADQELIRATVLRLPMRSGLQVMAGAWDLVAAKEAPSGGELERASAAALDILRQVASTSLMSLDLDESGLTDPNSGRVLGALSEWMASKPDLWLAMSRCHPGGVDEKIDFVSIRIAAQLVELFLRQPHAMVDYWLRISTIREKLDRGEVIWIPQRASDRSTENGARDLQALLEHVNAGMAERATQFVSRLAAWDAGRGRQVNRRIRLSGAIVLAKHTMPGDAAALQLYGVAKAEDVRAFLKKAFEGSATDQKSRLLDAIPAPMHGYHQALKEASGGSPTQLLSETGSRSILANSLASLEAGLTGDACFAAMLPAFHIVSGQGAENGAYSVLRLIAFISEMIGSRQPSISEETVKSIMNTLVSRRSYPTTTFSGGDSSTDERPGNEGSPRETAANTASTPGDKPVAPPTPLSHLLAEWLKSLEIEQRPITVAPVTLSRMWTRFTYAFDAISSELKLGETRYLGVLMHRSITAFLHAVGLEAVRASGISPEPQAMNNPVRHSAPLLEVLKTLKKNPNVKNDQNVRFFKSVFSCPLWGYYLASGKIAFTGRVAPRSADREVFDLYKAAVVEATKQVPSFEIEFKTSEYVLKLEGPQLLLNSVPIQGQAASSKPAQQRTSELGELISSVSTEIKTEERPLRPRAVTKVSRKSPKKQI
ncbi:hypothetical protein OICFNHDK_3292 [Methylobacterium bullatum]|uniref:ATP-binding protein n=1 Tax=Methylobacterium bullatum TaxID=570505 RepID=A0AAV4ZA71_9HYPH|nr:hypothetical protein [Methylobacterium bullatum]GJD40816.1 hypothetical protein OICFNHDK_3292 [Methylobacterium bullatum]